MFKRVIWWSAGFGAGLGSSFWVKRAVNRRVQRYVPDEVRRVVGEKARSTGSHLRSAISEGRAAMRQYEADAVARVEGEHRTNLRAVPD